MDKTILLQKQVKDNSVDLQNEYLDLKNWEEQMKRKDNELKKEAEGQVTIPPIRSKNRKKTQGVVANENENKETQKKIKSYDSDCAKPDIVTYHIYQDSVDKPISTEELKKAHELAMEHKQKGNILVQQKQWNEAVSCYSAAIQLFAYDAIFYANRALCQLHMDRLCEAESDCSMAIQLDTTYIKAYLRRATARMRLQQYKKAKEDLQKVLKLESSNKEAKSMLSCVNKNIEDAMNKRKPDTKIKENLKDVLPDRRDPRIPAWLPEKDDVAVVEAITKPPHLRSKKPLTRIPVEDVDFSAMQFNDHADKTLFSKDQPTELPKIIASDILERKKDSRKIPDSAENVNDNEIPPIPKTAVQFLMNWNRNKSTEFRFQYLKQLYGSSLPRIFQESMESNIFSEILHTLRTEFMKREQPVFWYLEELSQVKRFRALIMFISNADKESLRQLFVYCKIQERISEEKVANLRQKYEV